MLLLGDGFGTCEQSALFASSPSPLRKADGVGTTGLLKVRGALAAALLLAVIMLMLAAASADAAFPGQNGKIAFSKENFRQGASGIFKVAPEGGAQEGIGPEYGYSPSWSADGEKLVFVGFSGENEREFEQDIYVMNKDGGDVERVTRSRAFEASPSFFPDSQRIAFARYTRDSADIFTKTLGTSGNTRLTDTAGFEESVAVSPEGSRIAFTKFSRSAGSSDVYVMNATGTGGADNITNTRRIDEFGSDWSPDVLPEDQRIAFTSIRFTGQDGPVARAAGSQEDGTITPEALTPESLARGASEPKETSAMPEQDVQVSVINANGTGREDLTEGPAYNILPAFSPSGDRIVFSRVTFEGRTERSELFVMDSDGTNEEQITDTPRAFEYEADWQPAPPTTP